MSRLTSIVPDDPSGFGADFRGTLPHSKRNGTEFQPESIPIPEKSGDAGSKYDNFRQHSAICALAAEIFFRGESF
uniref:Uncharacterized protein n=1 Tax=Leptospira ellisii TaxID=2023197 RepID=A0A2N0BDJ1_9LEPT|nr:hypothetical protein CH379_01595 [Leptospira ellisii]